MPDTRAHDEVYCPDCGLRWVADEGVHTRGCRHLDLAKHPSEMDGEELRRLVLWLVDGGDRRMAPSEPDWSAEDYSGAGRARRARRRLPEPVRRPVQARQHQGPVTHAPDRPEAARRRAMDPKYPDVQVQLSGGDGGNAFAVLGTVAEALRRAGHADQVDAYMAEATGGSYDELLQTTMRWVEVA